MAVAWVLLLLCPFASGYRPLVMIHGLDDDYGVFDDIIAWAQEAFPGIQTFALSAFNGDASRVTLRRQVPVWAKMVTNITDQYGEITLLGYSQGGLVARTVVEYANDSRIHTLIALSSPGAGQYGIPDTPYPIRMAAPLVYTLCYNPGGQQVSVCDYWNDPRRQRLYRKRNKFLPLFNNLVNSSLSAAFKTNFIRLAKFVMIGGPGDDVIMPWQSAHYGFFAHDRETIVPYRHQQFYTHDSFGLRSLDERGGVHTCTVDGVTHTEWPRQQRVFTKCIQPYLG